MGDVSKIWSYHAHVYFDLSSCEAAERLRAEVTRRFSVQLSPIFYVATGPHPAPMFIVIFEIDQFEKIVPWLMLNREGLSVLVHPRTGDEVADHTTHAGWLGPPLVLDETLL